MTRSTLIAMLASLALADVLALPVAAQPTDTNQKATQFVPIENEPTAELFVDPPLAGPLARGAAIVPYRTRHFRILPVFGASAVDVSPRPAIFT